MAAFGAFLWRLFWIVVFLSAIVAFFYYEAWKFLPNMTTVQNNGTTVLSTPSKAADLPVTALPVRKSEQDTPAMREKVQVQQGWHVNQTHGLSSDSITACKGKLVVDMTSSECKEIPAKIEGGPKGKRCPNVCQN